MAQLAGVWGVERGAGVQNSSTYWVLTAYLLPGWTLHVHLIQFSSLH